MFLRFTQKTISKSIISLSIAAEKSVWNVSKSKSIAISEIQNFSLMRKKSDSWILVYIGFVRSDKKRTTKLFYRRK